MGFIYLIQNKNNGKQYIGQTISSIGHRWAQHKNEAKKGSGFVLHQAIRKHGVDAFTIQQLCAVETEFLDEYEEMFIALHDSMCPRGYNIKAGGNSKRATVAQSRSRQDDAGLPLYVTHYKDYTAKTEGYRVRHTPSGQKATISSRYLTMPQKLELALKFLEEAKVGRASKPPKVYKPRDLPPHVVKDTTKDRRERWYVRKTYDGKLFQRLFYNLADAIACAEQLA